MRIFFYHPTSCSAQPEPTVGLGILTALALQKGHDVEYYDHDLHVKHLVFADVLKTFRPDIFAVGFMTPQYYHAKNALELVKHTFPSCITIAGGPHPSSLPEQTLNEIQSLDFLCKGEGEKTFVDFLALSENGSAGIGEIPGLYRRHKETIVVPPERPLMSSDEIECLPMPAWDIMLKRGLYMQQLNYAKGIVPVFSVITARGCPFECTFCDERSIWKRRVREKSIDNVIKEIRYLKEKYHAKHFNILDDTFSIKPKRVVEFCDKVKNLNIQYRVTAKVATVNQEMLDNLAASGCKLVAFGVESGDENVLSIMKKRQTLEQVRTAFEMTNNTGMMSYALCMVGNIGEDFNAVKKTARFAKEIDATLFSASIMTPYPGSENYEICTRNNWILTRDWKKWCPSPIRLKEWEPVARTDKMDKALMLKSYYYLNRAFMFIRFRRKYGLLYFLNPFFYTTEIIDRLRVIGLKGFGKHIIRLINASNHT